MSQFPVDPMSLQNVTCEGSKPVSVEEAEKLLSRFLKRESSSDAASSHVICNLNTLCNDLKAIAKGQDSNE